jgi:hypothetical protein
VVCGKNLRRKLDGKWQDQMVVVDVEKKTWLEAWLLSGWQALTWYEKLRESVGSLAAMESAAAGTEEC